MGAEWFGLGFSRSGAIGDELLKVQSEFFKQRLETTRGYGGGEQPATDLPLDLVDCQGSVDLVGRIRVDERLRGDIGGERIEVVKDRLGPEILPRGVPGLAGGMLQFEPMLDALVCLLAPPARCTTRTRRAQRRRRKCAPALWRATSIRSARDRRCSLRADEPPTGQPAAVGPPGGGSLTVAKHTRSRPPHDTHRAIRKPGATVPAAISQAPT